MSLIGPKRRCGGARRISGYEVLQTVLYSPYAFQRGTSVSKFKIGESVRLRSSVEAGREVGGEYRIVRQLPQTDSIVRYRVRSAADEQDEVTAKESELSCWQNPKVRAPRSVR
jgi:hypothetical protein